MKIWGVYDDEIREIAAEVGLAIHGDWRGTGIKREGRAYRFRLKLNERREDRRLKYQKLGWSERKTSAVCWHGHRDFMTALFRRFPEARVKTALADYRGRDEFHRLYPTTCGVQDRFYGTLAGSLCVCNTPPRERFRMPPGLEPRERIHLRASRTQMIRDHRAHVQRGQQRVRDRAYQAIGEQALGVRYENVTINLTNMRNAFQAAASATDAFSWNVQNSTDSN